MNAAPFMGKGYGIYSSTCIHSSIHTNFYLDYGELFCDADGKTNKFRIKTFNNFAFK